MWTELFIALAGGVLGAAATIASVIIKTRQTRQDTWWNRFTWATGAQASSDAQRRAAAREVLQGLANDSSASLADRKAANAMLQAPVKIYVTGAAQRDSRIEV